MRFPEKEDDVNMSRDTRLLYVENDPVLRSMMTTVLEGLPGIELVASVSGSVEALEVDAPLDVALLDWALGPESLNGVELGHALRKRDDDIGIVILSQHYAWDFHGASGRVDMGWSYVEKRVNLDTEYLTKVIKATATAYCRQWSRSAGFARGPVLSMMRLPLSWVSMTIRSIWSRREMT